MTGTYEPCAALQGVVRAIAIVDHAFVTIRFEERTCINPGDAICTIFEHTSIEVVDGWIAGEGTCFKLIGVSKVQVSIFRNNKGFKPSTRICNGGRNIVGIKEVAS